MFLYPDDITFKLLRKSTSYFGFNPRGCFNASCSVTSWKVKKEKVKAQISYVAAETSHILQAVYPYQIRMGPSSMQFFNFPQAMSYDS